MNQNPVCICKGCDLYLDYSQLAIQTTCGPVCRGGINRLRAHFADSEWNQEFGIFAKISNTIILASDSEVSVLAMACIRDV